MCASSLHTQFGVALDAGDEPMADLGIRIASAVAGARLVRVRGIDMDEHTQLALTESLGMIVGSRDKPSGSLVPNVRYERGDDRFAHRWHADQSWATTDAWSVLFCVEADVDPDPTLFVDTASALRHVGHDLIDRIGDRTVLHDLRQSRQLRPANGQLEQAEPLTDKLLRRLRKHLPRRSANTATERPVLEPTQGGRQGTRYPLIDQCSSSGQSHLRVGDHAWSVSGLDAAEGQQLLDDLHAELEHPANVFRQEWQSGDLVVFDNRFVLHRRETAIGKPPGRVLRRTLAVPNT